MSDIYAIRFFYRARDLSLMLAYRSEERFKTESKRVVTAYEAVLADAPNHYANVSPIFQGVDEFRDNITVDLRDVMAVMCNSSAEAHNLQGELEILNAHAQIKGMKRAEADPDIKAHNERMAARGKIANAIRGTA